MKGKGAHGAEERSPVYAQSSSPSSQLEPKSEGMWIVAKLNFVSRQRPIRKLGAITLRNFAREKFRFP